VRNTPVRFALTGIVLALGLAAPAEAKDVVVYVCGKDLCRVAPDGSQRQRLTRDGARSGPYSRPSISQRGRRLAFRKGTRGRVYTARVAARRLRGVRRIGPAPDGPRDATQFDVALSRDGRRVAWVELRINVVFRTIDYRRYAAAFDGSGIEQVAASGGRPFVGFFDNRRILREGLADSVESRPDAQTVDQGLCVPDPESEQNGTCGDQGPQAAFDPQARHLRHPHVSRDGRRVVATAYRTDDQVDNSVEQPGQLLLFDVSTALPVRELTTGASDLYPSFSPDGRRVIFERSGSVRTIGVNGGRVRRVVKGVQPTWGR
jgi:WD40-like Beta Propeller Repeat